MKKRISKIIQISLIIWILAIGCKIKGFAENKKYITVTVENIKPKASSYFHSINQYIEQTLCKMNAESGFFFALIDSRRVQNRFSVRENLKNLTFFEMTKLDSISEFNTIPNFIDITDINNIEDKKVSEIYIEDIGKYNEIKMDYWIEILIFNDSPYIPNLKDPSKCSYKYCFYLNRTQCFTNDLIGGQFYYGREQKVKIDVSEDLFNPYLRHISWLFGIKDNRVVKAFTRSTYYFIDN